MRRKPGALLALELDILTTALDQHVRKAPDLHGFAMAAELRRRHDARGLTAHGTLYKALGRLEKSGFLESQWEDPLHAQRAGRPRRRLYRITAAGEAALATASRASGRAAAPPRAARAHPRPAPGGLR